MRIRWLLATGGARDGHPAQRRRPGVLLHLLQTGVDAARLEHMLHHESGLQALAGTADMRELLARDDPAARDAIELFCYRIVKAAIAGRSQGIFSEPSRFLHRSGNSVQASPSTASHP